MIRSTWALPLLLGLCSVIGLVIALAGDGWHDWIAWAALGAPVAATVWAMRVQRS
jgi:hypothetical protein